MERYPINAESESLAAEPQLATGVVDGRSYTNSVIAPNPPSPIEEESTDMNVSDVGGLAIPTGEPVLPPNTTVQATVPPAPDGSSIPEQQAPVQRTPINLAEGMEALAQAKRQQVNMPQEEPEQQEPVTVINVAKGEAENVIQNMPLSTYDKITKSSEIRVNEIELKDVPVATRTITDMAEYNALKRRRKHKKTEELTERVLVNSGIVVVLKGATSIKMATIFKDMFNAETDWAKTYQFCYEHTVDTSIGKLSFDMYTRIVAPADLETVLNGIYELSEVDERKVEIRCGIDDGGCGTTYDVKVKISSLPDLHEISNDTKARIKEIVDARNDIERSKEIQKNSPSSVVKYVQLGDRVFAIRIPNGNIVISRGDLVGDVERRYNPLVGLLFLYIEKITVTLQQRDDVEAETVDIRDVEQICEELVDLEDDELDVIKGIISTDLKVYNPITYSLKGTFQCPNCGMTKTVIPCQMSDLVFQKAQRTLI